MDRRQVVDDVRRGDHVVQRERPLVGHFAVDGSVLRDGAFETDLHLRVRAGLPMFGHVLVREYVMVNLCAAVSHATV